MAIEKKQNKPYTGSFYTVVDYVLITASKILDIKNIALYIDFNAAMSFEFRG